MHYELVRAGSLYKLRLIRSYDLDIDIKLLVVIIILYALKLCESLACSLHYTNVVAAKFRPRVFMKYHAHELASCA